METKNKQKNGRGGFRFCVNCDCEIYEDGTPNCKCGCYGIGECVVCGYEASEWKCKKCGGWVCGECIITRADNHNICFDCYIEGG